MKSITGRLFPASLWTRPTLVFAGGLFVKFLLFDLLWCLQTTFTSFSFPQLYLYAALAALFFLAPYVLLRRQALQGVVLFLLDGLLVANLMYSRTYYAAIPLDSYGLAGNLSDFTASVYDSLRGGMLCFRCRLCFVCWECGRSRIGPRLFPEVSVAVLLPDVLLVRLFLPGGRMQRPWAREYSCPWV